MATILPYGLFCQDNYNGQAHMINRVQHAGYFMLTCPDCLRAFRRRSTPKNNTVEQAAVCTHCEARVPFQIESSGSE